MSDSFPTNPRQVLRLPLEIITLRWYRARQHRAWMFTRVLIRIRDKIREHQYVVTEHARKEMNDDQLTILDSENAILTGEILERQRDQAALEPKYRIRGRSLEADWIEAIVKMTPTGKVLIVTVYKV